MDFRSGRKIRNKLMRHGGIFDAGSCSRLFVWLKMNPIAAYGSQIVKLPAAAGLSAGIKEPKQTVGL
jgi:hypothetical protein